MENEEKTLLLRDLCARLPYGVFVEENRANLDPGPVIYTYDYHPCIDNCKPYLHPMSSITEEEKREYFDMTQVSNHCAAIDYLNAHHFDYRGLIPMGLALEAPEGMYKIK